MALKDILEALGVERVVWIDDIFGEPQEDLAVLARKHPVIKDEFEELAAAFALEGFDDVDASLEQTIADLNDERRAELRAKLLELDAEDAPAPELAKETIEAACNELGVAKGDRWTFEMADQTIGNGALDDADVAYLVDLKEGGGLDKRGLDILKLLRAQESKGVAFILTHEAAPEGEGDLEGALAQDIGAAAAPACPITVISKARLEEEGADIEVSLAVALKRAGLRRALHLVLSAATPAAAKAYSSTAALLLGVDPERLEYYVYERAREGGESELSVVEQALGAGASQQIRAFFGSDPLVAEAVKRLRALKAVPLEAKPTSPGPILSQLRDAELWDDGALINGALSPLANGDVFRFDPSEPNAPKSPRLFVLLGQPCDIALRADGKRICDAAMLVPLIEVADNAGPMPDADDPAENEAIKAPEIPFRFKGKRFKLNLRDMIYARLAILDLATFRPDGCVRVEAGHVPSDELLAGAKSIYQLRTAGADEALAGAVPGEPPQGTRPLIDDRLLLTMTDGSPWDRVRVGKRLGPHVPNGGYQQPLADRVTWFFRREGRIRAPFSSFLLERALRTLGRRAFDTDFAA